MQNLPAQKHSALHNQLIEHGVESHLEWFVAEATCALRRVRNDAPAKVKAALLADHIFSCMSSTLALNTRRFVFLAIGEFGHHLTVRELSCVLVVGILV